MGLTIGVDIGGTKVLGAVVDPAGVIVAQARRSTPTDPVTIIDQIAAVVEELKAGHDVAAVGIGVAAWINADRSEVLFAPNLALRDAPLGKLIQDRVRLPVVVENDANVAAWAEFRFGAARAAHDSMALVTVGTGIGGGLVVGGELLRGAFGMAGEPGHMRAVPDGLPCPCGRHGCLEQYASGTALVRFARQRAIADPDGAARLLDLAGGVPDAIDGPLVTTAAKAGDPAARDAFAEIGRWLGAGLADLVYLIDPEILVVGGGVAEAGELLMDPVRASFAEQHGARGRLPLPAVVPALMGNGAGVVGAADLAARFVGESR
jgi:glucokinase